MPIVPIQPPLLGVADGNGYLEQKPGTSRLLRNCRAFDGLARKERLCQRPGTRKYIASSVSGSSPVKDMGLVVYETPRFTFTNPGTPSVDWENDTPSASDCPVVTVDLVGDVYVVDAGSALAVYNDSGTLLKRITLPVQDKANVCRALFADPLTGMIFVAVSEGGEQSTARGWAFERDSDAVLRQAWEFDFGGFVEQFDTSPGFLFALLNSPDTGRAFCVKYSDYTTAPLEAQRASIPFPASDLSVNQIEGSIAVASDANAERGKDPRDPNAGPVLDDNAADWLHSRDLNGSESRFWCHLRAGDLAETLADGDDVELWTDRSGNGRHLFRSATVTPPTFKAVGLGGRGAVYFDGSVRQLVSAINASSNYAAENTQRTIVPMTQGGSYCTFILCRPSKTGTRATVLSQPTVGQWGGGFNQGRGLNVVANKSAPAVTTDGQIGVEVAGVYASVPGTTTVAQSFENQNDAVLVTVVHASQLAQNVALIRINGRPWARFTTAVAPGVANLSCDGPEGYTRVGYDPMSAPATAGVNAPFSQADNGSFAGEILEILTLRDWVGLGVSGLGTNPDVIEEPGYPTTPYSASSDTEIERIEGELMWHYGVAHLLDDGLVSGYPHPYRTIPPSRSGLSGSSVHGQSLNVNPMVSVYRESFDFAWTAVGTAYLGGADIGGVGYACKWRKDGKLVSVGRRVGPVGGGTDPSRAWINAFVDEGTTFSTDWRAFVSAGTIDPTYAHPKIAVDAFDNVWLPWNFRDFVGGRLSLYAFNASGTDIIAFGIPSLGQQGMAVALPPSNPDYSENPTPITRPEFVFLGTEREYGATLTLAANPADGDAVTIAGQTYTFRNVLVGAGDVLIGPDAATSTSYLQNAVNYSGATGVWYHAATPLNPIANARVAIGSTLTVVAKAHATFAVSSGAANATWDVSDADLRGPVLEHVRVVARTNDPSSTRVHTLDVVAGGNIRTILGGAVTAIPGGDGAVRANARYVCSVDLFGERFFTDGLNLLVHNPRLDTVVPYRARSSGSIPSGCQLIDAWRGAIMLLRDDQDPQNWHLSRRRFPYDWDKSKSPPTSDMAISGNDSFVGRVPDVINCFAPWNDDLAIFGCDSTVWRLTGDPMSRNSSLDNLNLGFGLAFGRPFCRDDLGRLWVINNHGHLYVATPAGGFRAVSEKRVDNRLQAVDFSTHHVRMEWDFNQKGLLIAVCPFGDVAGSVEYYFYDLIRGGFWPEDRALAGHRIHSLAILNGDLPSDRVMLAGCEDGSLRLYDDQAFDDDGEPIDSEALLGPYSVREAEFETMSVALNAIFDPSQYGALLRAYASNDGVTLGDAEAEAALESGMSDWIPFRARGNYYFVSLRNASKNERWALERLLIEMEAGGARRNRW